MLSVPKEIRQHGVQVMITTTTSVTWKIVLFLSNCEMFWAVIMNTIHDGLYISVDLELFVP